MTDDDGAHHHPWVRQAILEDNRDRALTLNWRPSEPGSYDHLRLPDLGSPNAMKARDQIMTEAVVSGLRWISYSRRWPHYANHKRYYRPTFSYRAVIPAIEQLAREGLIEHEKMPPGHRGFQSRFRASSALLTETKETKPLYEPLEIILLRDSNGDLVDYRDNRKIRAMRSRLTALNEGLASQQVALDGRVIHEGDILDNGGRARAQLHRVFHRGEFDLGGRFYGAHWQNIGNRHQLTINGQETIEHDYTGIHIRLLYHEAGKEMRGDPYDFGPRKHAKLAVLIGINARSTASAIRALADALRGKPGINDPYEAARSLLKAAKARHPDIAHAFGSDAGVRLMQKDAEIAERVMMEMVRETGIVPLAVHDSFIVPANQKERLREIMDRALNDTASIVEAPPDFATCLVVDPPKETSKVLPQYGTELPGLGGPAALMVDGTGWTELGMFARGIPEISAQQRADLLSYYMFALKYGDYMQRPETASPPIAPCDVSLFDPAALERSAK
jgi:hypothetical protein